MVDAMVEGSPSSELPPLVEDDDEQFSFGPEASLNLSAEQERPRLRVRINKSVRLAFPFFLDSGTQVVSHVRGCGAGGMRWWRGSGTCTRTAVVSVACPSTPTAWTARSLAMTVLRVRAALFLAFMLSWLTF